MKEETKQIINENNLNLFIKEIFVLEGDEGKSLLPFFADGYPGIIYCQTKNNAVLLPQIKELSTFFLYGQTIKPIELLMDGPYRLIVFQLYPFAPGLLFDVDTKDLNDDCYDLSKINASKLKNPTEHLTTIFDKKLQIELVVQFLSKLAQKKGREKYQEIQVASQTIVQHKGIITVSKLAQLLNVSERTLQRKFKKYVGISPKKFAKIIQFQASLQQISEDTSSKLTDVVYENGYADQSHFIRNIKRFTGKKPSELKFCLPVVGRLKLTMTPTQELTIIFQNWKRLVLMALFWFPLTESK